jgi:multiple sugar transport system permease protein
MPLISTVGRKTLRVRLLLAAIYLILSLGALSMLYPFALMFSNSITSYADYNEYRLIPTYLHSESMLFKKYIVDKVKTQFLGYEYGRNWFSPIDIKIGLKIVDTGKSVVDWDKTRFTGVKAYSKKVTMTVDELLPIVSKPQDKVNLIIDDWKEIYPGIPDLYKFAYFTHTGSSDFSLFDIKKDYRKWLYARFKTVDALNKAYIDNAEEFDEVSVPYEDPLRQRWLLPIDEKYKDWQNFKRELPFHKIWVVTAEFAFQKFLLERYPLVADLRNASGLPELKSRSELTLARAWKEKLLPESQLAGFVKRSCPVIFLRLDPSLEPQFREFITKKYEKFSAEIRNEKARLPFLEFVPMDSEYIGAANEWIEFMEQKVPMDKISFRDPMIIYQDFLRAKYGNVVTLNDKYGLDFKNFEEIRLPVQWIDVYAFKANKSEIFRTYLTGNYGMVFNVIAVHGRALINTIIYIALAIICSLTFNPLAAYALSRYRLPYTNKILIFLLATMAFPHAVGMIPSFLLLKDFGMLNTFFALVLPGLANGYSIFLLKGFFDSLPTELYEASMMDGASELTIFYRMALPLTKPILAIIALGAFTHAYSSFMFAFLTCQNPKMWTLMVFLYEFQQNYPNYLVMSSLIIAAIPTLLVFVFCQNIILRGIVVPSFK